LRAGMGMGGRTNLVTCVFSWAYCNLHQYLIWWIIQLDIFAKLLHLDDFSRSILSQFTEEQMSRYESFRRAGFQKSNMKRVCFLFYFYFFSSLLLPLSLGLIFWLYILSAEVFQFQQIGQFRFGVALSRCVIFTFAYASKFLIVCIYILWCQCSC